MPTLKASLGRERLLGAAVAVVCVALGLYLEAAHDGEDALRDANVLALQGRYDDAVAASAAAAEPPARSRADALRAYAHLAAGRLPEAAASFSAALRRDPNDWVLQRDYGTVLLGLGRRERAQARMRRALRLNPRMQLPPGFVRGG